MIFYTEWQERFFLIKKGNTLIRMVTMTMAIDFHILSLSLFLSSFNGILSILPIFLFYLLSACFFFVHSHLASWPSLPVYSFSRLESHSPEFTSTININHFEWHSNWNSNRLVSFFLIKYTFAKRVSQFKWNYQKSISIYIYKYIYFLTKRIKWDLD